MEYNYLHLLNWLKTHECIAIQRVEEKANLPKGTLRHFIKDRRALTESNYNAVCIVLNDYGYSPID